VAGGREAPAPRFSSKACPNHNTRIVRSRTRAALLLRTVWGLGALVIALLALPVSTACTTSSAGINRVAQRTPIIHHDLSSWASNVLEGLSNGAIWALIAIGYTSSTGSSS